MFNQFKVGSPSVLLSAKDEEDGWRLLYSSIIKNAYDRSPAGRESAQMKKEAQNRKLQTQKANQKFVRQQQRQRAPHLVADSSKEENDDDDNDDDNQQTDEDEMKSEDDNNHDQQSPTDQHPGTDHDEEEADEDSDIDKHIQHQHASISDNDQQHQPDLPEILSDVEDQEDPEDDDLDSNQNKPRNRSRRLSPILIYRMRGVKLHLSGRTITSKSAPSKLTRNVSTGRKRTAEEAGLSESTQQHRKEKVKIQFNLYMNLQSNPKHMRNKLQNPRRW